MVGRRGDPQTREKGGKDETEIRRVGKDERTRTGSEGQTKVVGEHKLGWDVEEKERYPRFLKPKGGVEVG